MQLKFISLGILSRSHRLTGGKILERLMDPQRERKAKRRIRAKVSLPTSGERGNRVAERATH